MLQAEQVEGSNLDPFAQQLKSIHDDAYIEPPHFGGAEEPVAEAVIEADVIEPAVIEDEVILADDGIIAGDIVDAEAIVDGEAVEGESEPEEPELDEKGRYVLPEGLVYDSWDRPINPLYPKRNPFTGDYWGLPTREGRPEREKRVRVCGYQGREARPEREAHVVSSNYTPRAQHIPDRPEYAHLREEQERRLADPDYYAAQQAQSSRTRQEAPEIFGQAGIKIDDYWEGINGYFDGASVPDTKMPTVDDLAVNYEPEIPTVEVENMDEDISINLESAKTNIAEDIAGESDAESADSGEESDAEGEDGEEDEEEPPKLEKEDYMTKAYYMPGYVDKTPEKEYPPHIRAFKNYLKSIGEFEKHGYEKEDYSPDTSAFKPDSSGFAPDTSGFAPNTAGFAPDTSTFGVNSLNKGGAFDKPTFGGQSNYRPDGFG